MISLDTFFMEKLDFIVMSMQEMCWKRLFKVKKELVQIQQFPKRTVYKNSRKGR